MKPLLLSIHPDYILPVSSKEFGWCGLTQFENGCYNNVRFIDVNGQEWIVDEVTNEGYTSWFQRLYWKKEYKSIKVSFSLSKGRNYSIDQLRTEIGEFLTNRRLRGSPFNSKKNEVAKYLASFLSINELITGIGYFDARNCI